MASPCTGTRTAMTNAVPDKEEDKDVFPSFSLYYNILNTLLLLVLNQDNEDKLLHGLVVVVTPPYCTISCRVRRLRRRFIHQCLTL